MVIKLLIVFFVVSCSFSCTSKTTRNNHTNNDEEVCAMETNDLTDKEQIKSLISKDLEKRNLWSHNIIASVASPLFYEAWNDDGLYLFSTCVKGRETCVIMLEDDNIFHIKDYINGPSDSLGVEYEHEGVYEIIYDSVVNVIFDEWCRNYCSANGSEVFFPIYHIRCTHRYKLSGLTWERIKSDSIVLLDERNRAFCGEDIWMYTH